MFFSTSLLGRNKHGNKSHTQRHKKSESSVNCWKKTSWIEKKNKIRMEKNNPCFRMIESYYDKCEKNSVPFQFNQELENWLLKIKESMTSKWMIFENWNRKYNPLTIEFTNITKSWLWIKVNQQTLSHWSSLWHESRITHHQNVRRIWFLTTMMMIKAKIAKDKKHWWISLIKKMKKHSNCYFYSVCLCMF